MGVLVAEDHRFAGLAEVPVASLSTEPLLLGGNERAPEFNQFVVELCRSVGFAPVLYRGTVQKHAGRRRAGHAGALHRVDALFVRAGRTPGVVWKPLVEPMARYPWSVLWRAADESGHVEAVRARTRALSQQQGWL
jgi:hypothetical protein